MASPHVVVSALYLEANPSAAPDEVISALQAQAAEGVIQNAPADTIADLRRSATRDRRMDRDAAGPFSTRMDRRAFP